MLVGIFHQYCVEDVVSSIGYIINFLFNIWDFMFVIHCHHQIRSINLSHCCHIFPRLCAWGGCTIISCRIHIYPSIPGKLFSHYYSTVVWCTQLIGYIILLFAHYSTSLSSLCRRIWKSSVCPRYNIHTTLSDPAKNEGGAHCVSKVGLRGYHSLSCVLTKPRVVTWPLDIPPWIRHCAIYAAVYIQLTNYLVIIVRNRVLDHIIKSEVWTICHCSGLGNETMVYAVCLCSLHVFICRDNSKTDDL